MKTQTWYDIQDKIWCTFLSSVGMGLHVPRLRAKIGYSLSKSVQEKKKKLSFLAQQTFFKHRKERSNNRLFHHDETETNYPENMIYWSKIRSRYLRTSTNLLQLSFSFVLPSLFHWSFFFFRCWTSDLKRKRVYWDVSNWYQNDSQ